MNVETGIVGRKKDGSMCVVDADIDTRGSSELPIEPRPSDRQGCLSHLLRCHEVNFKIQMKAAPLKVVLRRHEQV